MDTELLVDQRTEDGRDLVSELIARGFEVSVAFWVRTPDDGPWVLYIATPRINQIQIGAAYGELYTALSRLPDPSLSISDIKLIAPDNPIAIDAGKIRDRHLALVPIAYNGDRLGNLPIEEALIYPPLAAHMNRDQLLRTVTHLMNRTGPVKPASFTLRDGTTFQAIPSALHAPQPGAINVVLHNVSTGSDETHSIDDILNIR